MQTPGTDPQNRFTTYVPGQQSTVHPDAPAGQLFYGDPGVERGVIPTAWNHVSPRVGIVWDPFGDGKTSIRAAAGVFYGSISGNEWNTMTNFQPWSTRLTFVNTGKGVNAAGVPLGATLSNPYNNYPGGTPFPYKGTYTVGGGIFGVDQDFKWSHAYQTNVGIQRQVFARMAVGRGLHRHVQPEPPVRPRRELPGGHVDGHQHGANILARRPNPAFGAVTLLDSDQYVGLQRPAAHVRACASGTTSASTASTPTARR